MINVLADTVSYGLGLFHNWWDLVAVSMAPDPAAGEVPPLRPEVLAAIAEVVAGGHRALGPHLRRDVEPAALADLALSGASA